MHLLLFIQNDPVIAEARKEPEWNPGRHISACYLVGNLHFGSFPEFSTPWYSTVFCFFFYAAPHLLYLDFLFYLFLLPIFASRSNIGWEGLSAVTGKPTTFLGYHWYRKMEGRKGISCIPPAFRDFKSILPLSSCCNFTAHLSYCSSHSVTWMSACIVSPGQDVWDACYHFSYGAVRN